MRHTGVIPNKYTYSMLLVCCARLKQVNTAIDLFHLMRTDDIVPDQYHCTNMLQVLANTQTPRLDLCQQVYAMVEQPSLVMSNVMMDACAKRGDVALCKQVYRNMSRRGLEGDAYTVSAMVNAFVNADRLEEAVVCLEDMYKAGLEVHSAAFGKVMDAYGRKGKLHRAIQVLDSMTLFGVQPTQTTYNTLIGACVAAGLHTQAWDLFEEMKVTSEFQGDRYTWHSLMKACLSTRRWRDAIQFYENIKESAFLCNQVTYRYALIAAGQGMDGDVVEDVVNGMKTHALKPREDTAAVLIAAAIRVSDLELALEAFAEYAGRANGSAEIQAFFNAIRQALRAFEEGSSARNDFKGTEKVVDELEKSWSRDL